MPEISIIMPNYNHGQYLPEAIEAVLNQAPRTFELIIIDDASTDNSLEIIKKYQKESSQIILHQNNKNVGVLESLNICMKQVKGKYLAFLASDDFCLPGLFENAMRILDKHPSIGLCCADPCFFLDKKPYKFQNQPLLKKKSSVIFTPKEVFSLFKTTNFWIPTHTSVYRKQTLIKFKPLFNQGLKWAGDWYLNHKIALYSGVAYVPKIQGALRLRKDSYSASLSSLPKEQNQVFTALFKILYKQESRTFRQKFKKSALLTQQGEAMIKYLLYHPYYWSFLPPILKKRGIKFLKRRLNALFGKLFN